MHDLLLCYGGSCEICCTVCLYPSGTHEKIHVQSVYILSSFCLILDFVVFQAFRDMNAYSTIEFVFKAKLTGRNIDSLKLLHQETLVRNG